MPWRPFAGPSSEPSLRYLLMIKQRLRNADKIFRFASNVIQYGDGGRIALNRLALRTQLIEQQ